MTEEHFHGSVRRPAVAGTFYPSDPLSLRAMVDAMLSEAVHSEPDVEPRLLIVPHAGYEYSGPIAASAYRLLQAESRPRRLVVIGPSHFVAFAGLATPGVEGLATPLGVVPVDSELTRIVEGRAAVTPNPVAHAREHSLEVQLPFLQAVLDRFTALALLTGSVLPQTVADIVRDLVGIDGVSVVISSDLSHYSDYHTARKLDTRTAGSICDGRPDDLGAGDACGLIGVQAALWLARGEGWGCSLLDLRSSGDTAGGSDSVVGYGAFVMGPAR